MRPKEPSPLAAQRLDHRPKYLAAPILILAVLSAYAEILYQGVFQFDDYNVIVGNPNVHHLQDWFHALGHGIRPLLKLSYTLNWIMGNGDILHFQLSNLFIHGINTGLVFLLSRRFIENHPKIHPETRSRAPEIACLSAAIFALHPIQTEAISYISGRSAALMSSFYLAGLLHHEISRGKNALHGLMTPILFFLALATKETAITFPLALLLWDIARNRRISDALRQALGSWILLAVMTAFVLLDPEYTTHLERSLNFNTLSGNLASNAHGTIWLLRQWWLPLWPNIDPDLPLLRIADLPALLSVGLLLGLALLAIQHRQNRPWVFLAIGWLFLQVLLLHTLLPRLDIANERQMTLAAWPMALLLAILLSQAPLPRRFNRLAGTLLLLSFLTLTMIRNHDYRSEIALWQSTVLQSPNKARAHNNLGYAYAQAGRTEEARRAYFCARWLAPQDRKAENNLKKLPLAHAAETVPAREHCLPPP